MKLLKMLQSVDILAINGPVDVEIEDISYVLNTPENTVKSHQIGRASCRERV